MKDRYLVRFRHFADTEIIVPADRVRVSDESVVATQLDEHTERQATIALESLISITKGPDWDAGPSPRGD